MAPASGKKPEATGKRRLSDTRTAPGLVIDAAVPQEVTPGGLSMSGKTEVVL
jgi:hypothetical protein